MSDMGAAYAQATAVSVSLAVGLGEIVKRGILPSFVGKIVPYSAVVGAGIFNLVAIRSNELVCMYCQCHVHSQTTPLT